TFKKYKPIRIVHRFRFPCGLVPRRRWCGVPYPASRRFSSRRAAFASISDGGIALPVREREKEDGSGREAFPSPEQLIEASSGAAGVDSRRGGALHVRGHRWSLRQDPYRAPRPRQAPYPGIPHASLGFYPHERFFVCPNVLSNKGNMLLVVLDLNVYFFQAITLIGKGDGTKGFWKGNLTPGALLCYQIKSLSLIVL
ncbi:hypothetical protein GW17_00032654, partial [Ensete ventricosum]